MWSSRLIDEDAICDKAPGELELPLPSGPVYCADGAREAAKKLMIAQRD